MGKLYKYIPVRYSGLNPQIPIRVNHSSQIKKNTPGRSIAGHKYFHFFEKLALGWKLKRNGSETAARSMIRYKYFEFKSIASPFALCVV